MCIRDSRYCSARDNRSSRICQYSDQLAAGLLCNHGRAWEQERDYENAQKNLSDGIHSEVHLLKAFVKNSAEGDANADRRKECGSYDRNSRWGSAPLSPVRWLCYPRLRSAPTSVLGRPNAVVTRLQSLISTVFLKLLSIRNLDVKHSGRQPGPMRVRQFESFQPIAVRFRRTSSAVGPFGFSSR